MMRFHFNTFNHCRQGRIIVEDITRIMGHQLVDLGHLASWGDDGFIPREQGYNVVLESFADDPNTLVAIARARQDGSRFLIVATEEPTPNGFNHGLEPAMIDRQNAFAAAAKLADGILHLVPGENVTAWYAQHAPSAYAELGYAGKLVWPLSNDVEPDHDFGFYGKMTWRRSEIIEKLEAAGAKVLTIETLDVPRAQRDDVMRHAKVIVQIRANNEWQAVSSTRCASALFLGRPVVAEPHGIGSPWREVVRFSSSVPEFVRDALALADGDWRGEHREQLLRFAATLPAERCVGRALKEIGVC